MRGFKSRRRGGRPQFCCIYMFEAGSGGGSKNRELPELLGQAQTLYHNLVTKVQSKVGLSILVSFSGALGVERGRSEKTRACDVFERIVDYRRYPNGMARSPSSSSHL